MIIVAHNFAIQYTIMSVIYILLSISILIALIFFIAFISAVKSGQYDDSYTPSVRMLFEDEIKKDSCKTETCKTKNKQQS
ncbi:cytochrome oxidase maturation protein, cbb3-type [Galbibacter orientalis DSM 19592]|uniref:Cytochrome oxidase maturation protein, cbb3-type n=2 Tax=Galbibacter TaxID=379068 RepID=I3C5C5_9FLAO|nr:cytochrome oxidase maturation protein, cbb3-type [Galbibacter orientalis DSM 19592]